MSEFLTITSLYCPNCKNSESLQSENSRLESENQSLRDEMKAILGEIKQHIVNFDDDESNWHSGEIVYLDEIEEVFKAHGIE